MACVPSGCKCSAIHFITRPRMGPSLGFVTDGFSFSVELCYILWSVLLHHWICIAPLEINCTFGVVLRHCFSILFEFQVIRNGCEGSDAEGLCDSDGNSNVKCGEVVSGKRCVACLET